MPNDRERISLLEEQVAELRVAIRAAGSLPIAALFVALDQMVDEQRLPASTRAEIAARLRTELAMYGIASGPLAEGAKQTVPRYMGAAEKGALREITERASKPVRETLGVRTAPAASDQTLGSPPPPPSTE